MEYVVFDLEWNGCYSKRTDGFINEIIEFGAVKLDDNLNEIGVFSSLVRPEISKRLSGSVKDLTSLSYEDLSKGAPFKYVYKRFSRFCSGCVLMTWSTSDLDALVSNIRYHYGTDRIKCMEKYADLQKYCQDRMKHDPAGNAMGLQAAAELLGIDTENIPLHRAADDSRLSAACLRKVYDKESLMTYIVPADEEFYDRLFFHPYYITSKADENYDEDEMYLDCPECSARADRKTDWELKFKSFVASFQCPECKHTFKGRIRIKKKYDGTVISRAVLKNKEQNTEEADDAEDIE